MATSKKKESKDLPHAESGNQSLGMKIEIRRAAGDYHYEVCVNGPAGWYMPFDVWDLPREVKKITRSVRSGRIRIPSQEIKEKQWAYVSTHLKEVLGTAIMGVMREAEIASAENSDFPRNEILALRQQANALLRVPDAQLVQDLFFAAAQQVMRLEEGIPVKKRSIMFNASERKVFINTYESISGIWTAAGQNLKKREADWRQKASTRFGELDIAPAEDLLELLRIRKPAQTKEEMLRNPQKERNPKEAMWKPFQLALVHAARQAGKDCKINQWATLRRIYRESSRPAVTQYRFFV